MGSLDMNGPYHFNNESIGINIAEVSGGNYALGVVEVITDNFHVTYVGRSDSDVKDRLIQHLDEMKNTGFKYSYASSPMEAFEKECRNYHDFVRSKKLNNKVHPEKTEGLNWKCPVCDK